MAELELESAEEWTEERIMTLNRDDVLQLWSEAPAVEMAELCGEYNGLIPNAGDPDRQKSTAKVMYNLESPQGYWLGKAYCPLSHTRGDGYNRYRRPDGTIHRFMRFATEMGTSLIDGKPALMMYYGAYQLQPPVVPKGTENTLVDEIRKLTDGFYLGVGTAGLPGGKRSEPGHFVLVGPVAQWVGADDLREELK